MSFIKARITLKIDNVPRSQEMDIKGKVVLVAEYEEPIRNVAKEMFEGLGCTSVLTAKDGESALAIVENRQVDLLLTDWQMPNIDGLNLIGLVRDVNAKIKIIFMSGAISDERGARVVEAAKSEGANAILEKPFGLRELRKAIEIS